MPPVNTTSRVVTVVSRGNTRPLTIPSSGRSTRSDPLPTSNASKAQSIWTTHTINF